MQKKKFWGKLKNAKLIAIAADGNQEQYHFSGILQAETETGVFQLH